MNRFSSVVAEDAEAIVDQLGDLVHQLSGRTVLVTGASGMVGSLLVRTLLVASDRLERSVHVVGMARSVEKARIALGGLCEQQNFELVIADAADASAYDGLRPDLIVHAASPASPTHFRTDPVGVIKANTLGTLAALESARRTHGHVTFISTMEVYGEVARRDVAHEVMVSERDVGVVDQLELRSAYPESKRLAETLCVAYAAQYGLRCDIVRLSHTYGPGMDLNDARVQAEFLRKALSGDRIVLKSDGSLTRTYTYVADAVSAIMTVVVTRSQRNEPAAFNVADDSSRTSIRQLAETVLTACGRPADDLVFDIADPSAQLWSRTSGGTFLDCSRIQALGWHARHHLPDGIARTVRHSRSGSGADSL